MSEQEKTNDTVAPQDVFGPSVLEQLDNLRYFDIHDGGEIHKCVMNIATADEVGRAQAYSNDVYNRKKNGEADPITHIVRQLPTKDNMIEAGREKGIWTDQDEIDYTTLNNQITAKSEQLAQGRMYLREAHQKCLELRQHRKDLYPLNAKRFLCYELTADAAAEEAYNKYMVVAITTYVKDGSRVFKDLQDFENPLNGKSKQAMQHYIDLGNFREQLVQQAPPEVVFFRDYGFLDENGNIYDFNKQSVLYNMYQQIEELENVVEEFHGFYADDGTTVVEPTGILKKEVEIDELPFDVGETDIDQVVINQGNIATVVQD